MKLSAKTQALYDLIAPAVAVCDVELWGLEFIQQGKRSLMRIYIDKPDATVLPDGQVVAEEDAGADEQDPEMGRGVGVQDCVRVTHQVSGVLDVHDPISGEYALEVSSPGWDRPFFSLEQMLPYAGQRVAMRLISAVENRRKLTGLLQQVNLETQQVIVEVDGLVLTIESDNIDKANLVYQD